MTLDRNSLERVRRRTFVNACLATLISVRAHGIDTLPSYLVGVWTSEKAVLRGQLLFEGNAIYLGSDGIGAVVGGPPAIGFKIVARFDPESSTIEFDAYEEARRGPRGSLYYDPKRQTLDSGSPQHQRLRRRFDILLDDTRRALGL